MAGKSVTSPLIRKRGGSLASSSSLPSSNESSSSSASFLSARLISITSLLLLIGVTTFFQWQVHQLATKISQDESHIDSLQDVLDSQKSVIERFNNSVTNSDVLGRLKSLEKQMTETESALKHDLKDTQDRIDAQLTDTIVLLNQTVKVAENEIEQEVDKVKADVEQYVRTTQDQFSTENDFMVYQLAGTFTLLSCLISMWHMTAHLRRFNQPVVQRKILAILWMSPIYAVTSWLSLVFPVAEPYLAIIKDFYEAYVIYQFLSFCVAVLGKGDREAVVDLLTRHADHLTPPFRCCGCFRPDPYETPRQLADAVLMQCQRFAMQFVFLRPLTSIALFLLNKFEYYGLGDGPTDYRSPSFWLIGLQNLSVFVAFAGLLKFYHAVDQDLAWCRPFAKFCCIKGVVFMTFWQGLAISILAGATEEGGDDAEAWAKSSQNFLICLEMLLFSIAHFYCFPVEEWEDGYRVKHTEYSFGDHIALGDFMQDLKIVLRSQQKKHRKGSLVLPEGKVDEDIVVEEGKEVILETPSSQSRESADAKDYSAIQDILDRGSDVDDDEIEEATKRLLACTLLPDEFDDIWDNGVNGDVERPHERITENDGDEDDGFEVQDDDNDDGHEGEEISGADSNTGVDCGSDDAPFSRQEARAEEAPPNEMTSLLGHKASGSGSSMASRNEELLRPSIFTTVSEIDAQRRMEFN
jgi:uncharacterized coiled-coil protein SlyX